MRPDLPSGTVTFLFTDVEGSTRLLHELGAEGYADALAEHRRVIREACTAEGGIEVDTQGDAFFFAFPTAPGALAAAEAFARDLAPGPIQVRVGLHTGAPLVTEEGYVGDDVHFGARVASSGHGGQVILSHATAELVELPLSDLGEHRLKDIAEAVSIYQLGEASFPPLKTISNTNLPRPASSFVGREAELQDVLSRIEAGARLVTLSGPGGTGKTRLALEAASSLVGEYKAGVFWIGLASLRDAALVTETIAQTLGAKDDLASHVQERELLLLLDNLEQVIDAAPALSSLLQACPNLTLLVTSRELLRIQGEVEYAVPPLAEPEAVALFCARSQLEPSEEIAELCARLDSLPLAVELAAARTKALTTAQILERLSGRLDLLKGGRDADPRQETLRATIEWSYDLLSPAEQQLFARLSVFAGGCALEAAEVVADADLDTLQSLVEKNLLRFTDERYWMLETIREYAVERLTEAGESREPRRRHAEWFLAVAEEADRHLEAEHAAGDATLEREWLDRLEDELDNLRAALDWLRASNEAHLLQRLAGALAEFWCGRDHVPEGHRFLEAAVALDGRTAARAKALVGAAHMARDKGDSALAARRAEQALALHRELGDTAGEAHSLLWLGQAVADTGAFSEARRAFEEGAALFTELGREHDALIATRMVAWMLRELGDWSGARALHEANLERARRLGNRRIEATTLGALASYAVEEGRVEDACSLAGESLRCTREVGNATAVATELCRCAGAVALTGRAETAVRLFSCADALFEQMGTSMLPYLASENEPIVRALRTQLDETTYEQAWADGRLLDVDEGIDLALASLD